jgi:riboflavin biosynthesis pyrimidine reductase
MRLLYHRDDPASCGEISDDRLTELYRHPLPADGAGTLVRSNFVSSLDGSVQGTNGLSGSINTVSDHHIFALQRAHTDAILVGAGTVRAEGYRGVDLADWQRAIRAAEGLHDFPTLVIVSGSLDLDPAVSGHPSDEVGPVAIVTAGGRTEADLERFRATGCTVVQQDGVRIDIGQVLDWLAAQGLHRVLCEGGPNLHRELLAGGFLDELSLTLAPRVVGGQGMRTTSGDAIDPNPEFDLLLTLYADDGALFTRYRRR